MLCLNTANPGHSFHLPGQQDPLVFLQLPHKAGVGFGDSAPFLHVVISPVQVPAVLLHGVGDHRGRRAAYSHLAVHQALRTIFPEAGERQKRIIKEKTRPPRSLRK